MFSVLIIGIYFTVAEAQIGLPIVGPGPWGAPICTCPGGLSQMNVLHPLNPNFQVTITPSSSLGYNGPDALRCPWWVPSTPTTCGAYTYVTPPAGIARLDSSLGEQLEIIDVTPTGTSPNPFTLRRIGLQVMQAEFVEVKLWDGSVLVDECTDKILTPGVTSFRCQQGSGSAFCAPSTSVNVDRVTIRIGRAPGFTNAMVRNLYLRTCVV